MRPWPVRVGALQKCADLIEPHIVVGKRLRIHFDANGGKGTSADRNLPHALHLRQFLRKHRRGDVIQLRPRHHVRLKCQQENRLVGRIDFSVFAAVMEDSREEFPPKH